MQSKIYDVLILGGGPAGLSIATSLARQMYSAVILDSGVYRNARATHMHNVPGFDHVDPAAFRAKARADLAARYESIEYRKADIVSVKKMDNVFEAVDTAGTVYRGRKVGLATGVRDVVEKEVDGYAECWGRGVFHCLFCHGFEERSDSSAGVLATGLLTVPEIMAHVAPMAKRLSSHVTIYTDGKEELAAATRALIKSSKISFDTRKITKLSLLHADQHSSPVVITFADGTTKTEAFIASHPRVEQAAPFAAQLGLEMTDMNGGEAIVTYGPMNMTSVNGVFAAGDAASGMRAVVQAMQMGVLAGTGLVGQLQKGLDEADEL